MISSVTRRRAMAGIAVLAGALPARLAAKSHISRSRVSAVTDELGKSQEDAIAFAEKFKLQWLELRNVPGSQKEFAGLTDPELKRAAAELGVAKMKIAMLHSSALKQETIAAAATLGAGKICVTGATAEQVEKFLPAVEQAKLELLVSNPEIVGKFPSKALGLDWDPVKAPDAYVKGRVLNVRVRILEEAGWRRRMEALDRDNYSGGISLETTVEKCDDALHDLLRLIDQL
jgi:hypothetical protein